MKYLPELIKVAAFIFVAVNAHKVYELGSDAGLHISRLTLYSILVIQVALMIPIGNYWVKILIPTDRRTSSAPLVQEKGQSNGDQAPGSSTSVVSACVDALFMLVPLSMVYTVSALVKPNLN